MARWVVLILGVFVLAPAPAGASTRYVLKSGSDGGNTTCDLSHPCLTLRHAATVVEDGDTILLGTGKFFQTGDAFVNKKDILIEGNGIFSTWIVGQPQWGGGRLLTVGSNGQVTLRELQLQRGLADLGGAIRNHGALEVENVWIRQNEAGEGGGIYNDGSLSLRQVEIALNTGNVGGLVNSPSGSVSINDSRIAANRGSGILNFGQLTMRDSVVLSNVSLQDFRSILGGDGVIGQSGETTIVNSTISGNRGRGLVVINEATALLRHVTIAANTIGLNADGGATVMLENTIVAQNDKADCMTGGGQVNGVTSLVGFACLTWPTPDNLIDVAPKLAGLAPNGHGIAWTHALLPGSPAIDAAAAEHCELTDQRGIVRPKDGDGDGFAQCDIGAYERVSTAAGRSGGRDRR